MTPEEEIAGWRSLAQDALASFIALIAVTDPEGTMIQAHAEHLVGWMARLETSCG